MADTSGGISGLGVGAVTVGGLLAWSALRNVSPVDTLREVLGKPSPRRPISTPFGSTASGVRAVQSAGAAAAGAVGSVAGAIAGDGGRLVQAAQKYLGVRYVFGGVKPTGMDCSGLVVLALRDIGVKAPRFTTATFGSWAKSQGAQRVAPADFRVGDVILRSGHMGISLGGDRLIHAPHTGTVVKEATIWDKNNWWGWRLFSGTAQKVGSK